MLHNRIYEKARGLVAQHLGVEAEKIESTTRFTSDLGADSLDTVELALAFEEEFGIEITDDKAVEIFTDGNFADLAAFLAEKRVGE